MSDQDRIESRLALNKRWYRYYWPLCLFCNHKVNNGDLAHIIPRSYASRYYTKYEQDTMLLNTGLAHRDCHDIYDNDKDQAQYLPRFREVMYITRLISPEYFNMLMQTHYDHLHRLEWEIGICQKKIRHHGELLFLPHLPQSKSPEQ
jgi:hypothetical protein